MRRPARVVVGAALAPLVVLGLAACTQPMVPVLPTRSASASPSPSASAADPRLTVQQAAGRAVRLAGPGTVASVDDESDGTVWGVRLVQEDGQVLQLHLRATDGGVLAGPSADATDADQQSENRSLVAASAISLAGAAQRMTAAVPKGRVTAIELGRYQDRVVWQGDVTNAKGVRQDVRIDAVNGSVLLNMTDGQAASGGS